MIPKFRAFYDEMMVHNAAKVGNALYWNDGKCFDAVAFKQKNPAILMQCTGFEDKYCTDIYTGDILKDDFGRVLIVEWYGYRFRFRAITETNFTYAYQIGDWFEFEAQWMPRPEIIGNIYENPDLLERYE